MIRAKQTTNPYSPPIFGPHTNTTTQKPIFTFVYRSTGAFQTFNRNTHTQTIERKQNRPHHEPPHLAKCVVYVSSGVSQYFFVRAHTHTYPHIRVSTHTHKNEHTHV